LFVVVGQIIVALFALLFTLTTLHVRYFVVVVALRLPLTFVVTIPRYCFTFTLPVVRCCCTLHVLRCVVVHVYVVYVDVAFCLLLFDYVTLPFVIPTLFVTAFYAFAFYPFRCYVDLHLNVVALLLCRCYHAALDLPLLLPFRLILLFALFYRLITVRCIYVVVVCVVVVVVTFARCLFYVCSR